MRPFATRTIIDFDLSFFASVPLRFIEIILRCVDIRKSGTYKSYELTVSISTAVCYTIWVSVNLSLRRRGAYVTYTFLWTYAPLPLIDININVL